METNVLRRAVASPALSATGQGGLKTSLNAYSFSRALNEGLKGEGNGVTLFDLVEYCAEAGFDGIDPTGYFFPGYPGIPDPAYLNEFKRRAFLLGLDITGTGVRNDFATPDKEKRAEGVRHVMEWIEVAARLGAPVIRVFAGAEPEGVPREDVVDWMAESLLPCVEHGKQHGVLVGIQNHGDFIKTSEQMLQIIHRIDSEWFGAIVDTGYFLIGDPYQELAAVAPYAVNWQVKEKVDGQAFRIPVDLDRVVQIANEAGYRGYLPIETLQKRSGEEDYDPRARAAQLLKSLQEAIRKSAG